MIGRKISCAYDMGCAFGTTLDNSSLGDYAKANQFRLMVGSFHGERRGSWMIEGNARTLR